MEMNSSQPLQTKYVRYVWSGTCLCGHNYDSHHHMVIANPSVIDLGGYGSVPGACLAFGCNENEGFDRCGKQHCVMYVDVIDLSHSRTSQWRKGGNTHLPEKKLWYRIKRFITRNWPW